jgi:hypothetical protein
MVYDIMRGSATVSVAMVVPREPAKLEMPGGARRKRGVAGPEAGGRGELLGAELLLRRVLVRRGD